MTSADDISAAIQTAKERFGPITAAVNCAGIGIAVKTLNKKGQAHSLEEFNRVLQVCISRFLSVAIAASTLTLLLTLLSLLFVRHISTHIWVFKVVKNVSHTQNRKCLQLFLRPSPEPYNPSNPPVLMALVTA